MSDDHIIIKRIKTNRNWMYFWGKYVDNVDLSKHCAKSLIGIYTTKFGRGFKLIENIVLDEANSKVFYICGVSKPYVWEQNFHLALMYEKGSKVELEYNGVYINAENCKVLPIDFKEEECDNELKFKREFGTCRNWQFSYLYQDFFKE